MKTHSTLSPPALLVLLAAFALSSGACATARATERYFADPKAPIEVKAANEAFLRGDFKELGTDIKRALLAYPGDASVQSDMLELFDKAYAVKGDHAIPADWSMPADIGFLYVGVKRRLYVDSGNVRWRMTVYGEMKKGQELEQIQIVHSPGEVIVDKQAGIGDYEPGNENGAPNFWFAQEYHASLNSEGLYFLTIKLKGQEAVQGWFVVSRLNASESPSVAVPAVNQSFGNGTPTFQWRDFVSPEYRSFENRKIYASVTQRTDAAKDNDWILGVVPPVTSATVGAGVEGESGVKSLGKGDYTFQISYRERFHFGDLMLSRESSSAVPFSVR